MTTENILEKLTQYCDTMRGIIIQATQMLNDLDRRLTQISQQIHKNMEIRDGSFAEDFNVYCQQLRNQLDKQDGAWTTLRTHVRA